MVTVYYKSHPETRVFQVVSPKELTHEIKVAGCSRQMLQRMRLFYQMYPQISEHICSPAVSICVLPKNTDVFSKWPPVVSKSNAGKPKSPKPLAAKLLMNLSWTHFVELIGLTIPGSARFMKMSV